MSPRCAGKSRQFCEQGGRPNDLIGTVPTLGWGIERGKMCQDCVAARDNPWLELHTASYCFTSSRSSVFEVTSSYPSSFMVAPQACSMVLTAAGGSLLCQLPAFASRTKGMS